MDFLRLSIPFEEFKTCCSSFLERFNTLKNQKAFSVEELRIAFDKLDDEVKKFLEKAFSHSDNLFAFSYRIAQGLKFKLFHTTETIHEITEDIKAKISALDDIIQIVGVCDLLMMPSDELYKKRQKYTIKEKESLILYLLSRLDGDQNYSIALIYQGIGFKTERSDEPNLIANKLKQKGLVDFPDSDSTDILIQITLNGIEHIQDLNEKAFNLYNPDEELSEKEKDDIKSFFTNLKQELIDDIKKDLQDQKDFIENHIFALNEVIQESLDLVDSKLPKKVIRQSILGKLVEKGRNQIFNKLMGELWTKLQASPAYKQLESETGEALTNLLIAD